MDSDPENSHILPGLTSENSEGEDESLIPAQEAVRIGTSVELTFDFPPRSRTIKIAEDSSGGCGGKVHLLRIVFLCSTAGQTNTLLNTRHGKQRQCYAITS